MSEEKSDGDGVGEEHSAAGESAANSDSTPVGETSAGGEPAVRPTESRRDSQKRKTIPDVATTVETVNELLKQARQAKGRQDHGKAFLLATQAWEASQKHPNDVQLRFLAKEVSGELDAIASLANSKFGDKAISSSTMLIDK